MTRDKLKEIYNKYNLDKDDIFILKFGAKQTPVIRRAGVEKIQAHLKIEVNFKIESKSDDHKSCIILATGCIFKTGERGEKIPSRMCQSYGEVSPANNTNNYPIAMAEKRALARVILKMANLFGVYSEDEAEDFKSNG
tara:strand:- start:3566 stop:3979 length:414 start_codon:yes stop_codon:yes gene_type:complete